MHAPLALLLLAAAAAAGAPLPQVPARTEVGPAQCHPDCPKHGVCGEDGFCRCPFGRLGDACEVDFLAPCRQWPGGEAICSIYDARSCECLKRCREWCCHTDSQGREVCHGPCVPPPTPELKLPCMRWQGVPADEQYSRVPEPAEMDKIKCYEHYGESAKEVPCAEAMQHERHLGLPLSRCPDQCNKHGYCFRHSTQQDAVECRCHRSWVGEACETEEMRCYNGCNGRGRCQDQFCHCDPPYFSIDCSRSKVYPPHHSFPHPAPSAFKVYVYELPTRISYDVSPQTGFQGFFGQDQGGIYQAAQKFLAQLLVNPARTEDPSEAHLFFLPSYGKRVGAGPGGLTYTGGAGPGTEHFHILIDYVKHTAPWWNRTQGRDHVVFSVSDMGACDLELDGQNMIKIVHFGPYTTPERHSPNYPHLGHPHYGCLHPLRDVVAAPSDNHPRDLLWLTNTTRLSVDELLALKTRLFFFAGSPGHEFRMSYSGLARQLVHNYSISWNDPEFQVLHGHVDDYEATLRASKFCFAPYGGGWGIRLRQAMTAGCVPIIIQEHVMQPYEDVLPFEDFSLRLDNADVPILKDILRNVSDAQYRHLLTGVLHHAPAFSWDQPTGGRAFHYTLLSLRRKYMNLKAGHYGPVTEEPP